MRFIFSILPILFLAGGLAAEPLSKDQQEDASQLFMSLGCRACHVFNKRGPNLAGSLDHIGRTLSEGEILHRLQLPPEEIKPGEKFMPSYHTVSAEQLRLLSRFLAERK